MNIREIIASLREVLPTVLIVLAVVVGGALVIWFLPSRTAAIIVGIVVAALLSYFILQNLDRITQVAILWLGIGITADAAYARVNDQTPVTIASALVKLAEAIIKLGNIMINSLGIPAVNADPRFRAGGPVSVAPEFVWALILGLVVLLAFNLLRRN
jgi:hypothetical protein